MLVSAEITPQVAFDHTVMYFLHEGNSPGYGDGACRYFSPCKANRCAIGAILPTRLAKAAEVQGLGSIQPIIAGNQKKTPVAKRITKYLKGGLDRLHVQFWVDLQQAHDNAALNYVGSLTDEKFRRNLCVRLSEFAIMYHLDTSLLNLVFDVFVE